MEYRLTLASSLVCEIVLIGRQADASAADKPDNWLHHEGQYLWRTFETKREDLLFMKLSPPFKLKELLDFGSHGDMEEGILKIQLHTHGALLEQFPDRSNVLHLEVDVTNKLIESLQIQDGSPFVRSPF